MSPASEHEDLGIILAIVFMSWTDQLLTEQEIELIFKEAHSQGLDKQELTLLVEVIHQPPSLETITLYLPTFESRKAAATAAYISALIDHTLTSEELTAFNQMCDVFGLSDAEREATQAFGAHEVPLTKSDNWKDALFFENLIAED